MRGILKDGTTVAEYMKKYDFYTSSDRGKRGATPNGNNFKIISMFQNNSFTKNEAIQQINSKIDYLDNQSEFVKWLNGYDSLIDLYKKLI